MADVPGLQLDRMTVKRTHDRDACVRTGSLFGLPRLSGLSNEERWEYRADKNHSANDPDPTMLHDLSSGERDGHNLGIFTNSPLHPHDRNARFKRWILMTMNRRLSTKNRRFPPKHYALLAGKPFPLHILLKDVEDQLNRRSAWNCAPQTKANHRCC